MDVFLESLLSESFPSLGVTVHLTSLGCPPTLCWSLDLLWRQLKFFFFLAAQVLIWSYSCVFLSTMSTAIRTSAYSLVGAQWLFIYSLDRVCQVNCVDLICKLYSWWEGFGSSSITTLPLAFNCGFISTSACGLTLGFAPETAPVRDECEGGIAAWLVRTLTCQVCRDMDCPHHRSYGPLRVFLPAFL